MADISIIHEGSTDYYVKDAAGRLALAEVENKGAKNLLKNTKTTTTRKGITFTINGDGSVTANGTNDNTGASVLDINTQTSLALSNGDYILTGCPAGGSDSGYMMDITRSPGSSIKDTGSGATFTVGGDYTVTEFRIVISRNVTVDNLKFYPMICTKAEWDISHTYVPYGKTNAELTGDTSTLFTENTRQETEIGVVANDGAKNRFAYLNYTAGQTATASGRKFTILSDGGIRIENAHSGTGNYSDLYLSGTWAGTSTVFSCGGATYRASIQAPDVASGSKKYVILKLYDRHTGATVEYIDPSAASDGEDFSFDATVAYISIHKNLSIPSGGIVVYPMIRPSSITDNTFVPYALPNPTLTPAAIKSVDEGAKNILKITESSGKLNTATIDIANDGSIHISGQPTSNGAYVLSSGIELIIPENAYILSRGAEAGNTKMSLSLRYKETARYVDLYSAESRIIPPGTYDRLHVYLYADTIYNTNIYPMICTAADWAVSKKFVPYAPTNRELYETCETKVTMQQAYGDAILIPANSDLNNYTTPGLYYALVANVPTIINTPYNATGLRLVVEKNTPSGAAVFQTIYPTSRAHLEFFRRIYEGGSWSSWYKFEGTEVT